MKSTTTNRAFVCVSESVWRLYRQRMSDIERMPGTDDPGVSLMLRRSAREQLRAEVREWIRLGAGGPYLIPV